MSKLFKTLAFTLISGAASQHLSAQELFVYTEPASNMPAHSLGLRASNWLMDEGATNRINYHFLPEIMWGVNKHLMLHAEGFISNRNKGLSAEGAAAYAEYRFYSRDKVYRHLRLAAFGRLSFNKADIHQEELETNGHNSGMELGLIATQLLHKQALSATTSYEQVTDNGDGNEFPSGQANKALNYTLSTGRLLLPKSYTGYGQINLNVIVELLGQSLLGNGKSYLDIAPSIQFIFNSQTRVDIGYRHELYSNMERTAPNGLMLRVEHLLFNAMP